MLYPDPDPLMHATGGLVKFVPTALAMGAGYQAYRSIKRERELDSYLPLEPPPKSRILAEAPSASVRPRSVRPYVGPNRAPRVASRSRRGSYFRYASRLQRRRRVYPRSTYGLHPGRGLARFDYQLFRKFLK